MKLLKEFVAEAPAPKAPAPIEESAEELSAKKAQFAELLLRNPQAFEVALVLYPNDTSKALRVATEWPNDPQVKTLQQSLLDGEEDFLPTKRDAAMLAFAIAKDESKFAEDRLKALRLYAEIRGFIEKPQIAVNNNNVTQVNKVLILKDHGTNEQWESTLRSQQKKLINGEYSSVN